MEAVPGDTTESCDVAGEAEPVKGEGSPQETICAETAHIADAPAAADEPAPAVAGAGTSASSTTDEADASEAGAGAGAAEGVAVIAATTGEVGKALTGVVEAASTQRKELVDGIQTLGLQLWGRAESFRQVKQVSEAGKAIITADNQAKLERMISQCKLLVSDVQDSEEAADTLDAGAKLLLLAQETIGQRLLEALQGMLVDDSVAKAIEDGSTVASDVLPEELARDALALMQRVMSAKSASDVVAELGNWAKWAQPETLKALLSDQKLVGLLSADGVTQLLANPTISQYLEGTVVAEWISSGKLAEVVGNSQILEWVRSGKLAEWVGSGQMAQWLQNGTLVEMVGNGEIVKLLENGELGEWVNSEALQEWMSAEKLAEMGIDVEHLSSLAAAWSSDAASGVPDALEKGTALLEMARESKQAQAMLQKAKEFMSSTDSRELLDWTKNASKEELIETVKNQVLEFLLEQLPAMEIPVVEGVKDNVEYRLDNLDLGGVKLRKEDVTVILNQPPQVELPPTPKPEKSAVVVEAVEGDGADSDTAVTGEEAEAEAKAESASDEAVKPRAATDPAPVPPAGTEPAQPPPVPHHRVHSAAPPVPPRGRASTDTRHDRSVSAPGQTGTGAGQGAGAGSAKRRTTLPDVFVVQVRNISATMKDIQWSYRKTTFPRLKGKGSADAVVLGGYLTLGFRVEMAPADSKRWKANDPEDSDARALLPQLSLSTAEVTIMDVGLKFKGSWMSAVYNLLASVFAASVTAYLTQTLKDMIKEHTLDLLTPVNRAASTMRAWKLILNLAGTTPELLPMAPEERWFDFGVEEEAPSKPAELEDGSAESGEAKDGAGAAGAEDAGKSEAELAAAETAAAGAIDDGALASEDL